MVCGARALVRKPEICSKPNLRSCITYLVHYLCAAWLSLLFDFGLLCDAFCGPKTNTALDNEIYERGFYARVGKNPWAYGL